MGKRAARVPQRCIVSIVDKEILQLVHWVISALFEGVTGDLGAPSDGAVADEFVFEISLGLNY